ncbi:MAG: Uma2 family endonuclease [Oscillatoriales cyanobacterium]|uniref:Uma2 family endonuclease n=1 Tax=Microcoleus anatoxicus PTRS2 TaxID=2705321 RepID=A0ABU8YN71_9CYAN|nr:MAG: Uma2 family endonuclease [Oscillatoriales cyanobacterium]TAD94657.1 MAG: Uma2 family endonuclease [Oscillatoriales cyanobacterium]TAE02298.1 MAG: Uma2 family endonuclease [Oscillatoriales cyanobacterium]
MVTTTLTPPQQSSEEKLITLTGIKWSTFKAIMSDVGDGRAWRIAYAEGVLEIRMPLTEHEEPKGMIESFVEAFADALDIEVRKLGALTLEREDLTRAIEPDSCFYVQNESVVRGKSIHLPADPPPDLVVESDYTSSSLNKFSIYASLGVPEIWRYRNQCLVVYQLVEGNYEERENSLAFPFLPIAEIPVLIEQSKAIGQRAAVRLFRERVREVLAQ